MAHDAKTVKELIKQELAKDQHVRSWHRVQLHQPLTFIVEPYSVSIGPLNDRRALREYWAILEERDRPDRGLLVVFDPVENRWGMARPRETGGHALITEAPTLTDLLGRI